MSFPSRNYEGVILDYADPSVRRAHHGDRRQQASDSARMRLIEAERELLTLYVIRECLDLPDFALDRIEYSLETIRMAHEQMRRDFGMPKVEAAA
jgi:hypothetical protein